MVVLGLVVAACAAVGQASAAPRNHGNQTVLTSHKGTETWVHGAQLLVVKMNGQKLSLYVDTTHRTWRRSDCYGRCAKVWIPLIDRGQIAVVNRSCHREACRIRQRQLGTVKRKDGSLQVTYYGHPLYRYRGDAATGQTNGEGATQFNIRWAAIYPNGNWSCFADGTCPY